MITKFKIFEHNNNEPQVGDYVYCEVEEDKPSKYIGQIIDIATGQFPGRYPYRIDDTNEAPRYNSRKEIIDFAKTPEELEHYMTANKYNL